MAGKVIQRKGSAVQRKFRMPTYEYHCDACEHEFEEFQSIKDEPLKKCPECGKSKLRRLFGTGAAVIFKGAGFYQTDYRSESYKAAAKAEQEAAKPADKTDKAATNGSAGKESSAKGGTGAKKSSKSDA
jgi:putative FmdB family regulatory protein